MYLVIDVVDNETDDLGRFGSLHVGKLHSDCKLSFPRQKQVIE